MPRRRGLPSRPQHNPPAPWSVERFRLFLDAIGDLGMAAMLREQGRWLYNRDISQWRVLVDISDELLDRETFEAKNRVLEKWIRKPRALMEARRVQRRSRRGT